MRLPRIIDTGMELHPISMAVNLEITPLSTVSMRLPKDENLPSRGFVEVFTPLGSAGIFRVRSPEDAYGDDITMAELEHAITEVGDYLVKDEYSEMMSASTAMQTVFSHYRNSGGSRWQLGDVSALGSGNIALEVNYERVLDAMLGILEQKPDCMMQFNFNTTPWTVSVVLRDTTVSAEGRLSRNVRSARVITDDTELCTRIYYKIPSTDSEGEPISVWTYANADTLSTYGLVERELLGGSGYTESEANEAAQEYLRQHKHPRITIQIDGEELSTITGETLDTFQIGKLYRLALPDYDIPSIEKCITGISWGDVFNSPESVSIRLGDEEDTVVNFLHDVDTRGGTDGGSGGGSRGGGGGGRKSVDDKFKEYRTGIDQDDYHIHLWSTRTQQNGDILQAAGLDINSQTGVIIYHDDVENGLGARLNVNAEAISSEVERASSAEGALQSSIIQTASMIRAEVSANNSAIYSEVVQTASMIRSEVSNSLSNFYTMIMQTASEIVIRTGDATKTYHQPDPPVGDIDNPLVDGDLWFNAVGQFTWGDAYGDDANPRTWLEDTNFDWSQLKTNSIRRYDGTTMEWVTVSDEYALLQDTRFEANKDYMRMIAGRVDVLNDDVKSYRAEFNVTADEIRSTVAEQVNGLQSTISQTEREIRATVADTNAGLHSELVQTADRIQTRVTDEVAGLSSSITQTASMIRSEVTNKTDQLSSSITQTASQIRSEVTDKANQLTSSITQTANRVAIVVDDYGNLRTASIVAGINAQEGSYVKISADKIGLNGYVTTSMLESAFQSVGQIVVDQLTIDDYFTCLGHNASWQSKTIRHVQVSTQRPFMYGSTSGATGTTTGSLVLSYSDSTIYYLGR